MVNTRATNANAHPGYIDLATPKRASAEVAKEREQKERAREVAVKKKAAGVQRVAELEKRMEEEDAQEQSSRTIERSAKNAPVKKGKGSSTKPSGGVNKRKKAAVTESDGSAIEQDGDGDQETQHAGRVSQSEEPEGAGTSELTELEATPKPPKKKAKQDKPSLRDVIKTAKKGMSSLQDSKPPARSGPDTLDFRTDAHTQANDMMDIDGGDNTGSATEVLSNRLGDRRGGSAPSAALSESVLPPRTKATPATPFVKMSKP
ncbi:hypothetical protein GY45DRAFT_1341627, partial [Cubamyces sp. BRFM 1775]